MDDLRPWFREKSYGRTSQPIGDFLGQLGLSTPITSLGSPRYS